MPRASRAQMELHRQTVLHAASKMVRERGVDGVTVPEVMATAGLTHGGFYRHFESKDALVAQACTAAFTQRLAAMDDALETTDNTEAARRAWLQDYLSPAHRDAPFFPDQMARSVADVGRDRGSGALPSGVDLVRLAGNAAEYLGLLDWPRTLPVVE